MILVIFLTVFSFTSAIILKDNGYEDVNIVIQDSVEQNWTLIERIKNVFTNASQHLFEATENRVYYRKINIIVPKTWTVTSETSFKVPSLTLTGYVTVEDGNLQSPYVKQQECGKEGQYMYLTPSFLLTTGPTKWGNHESVIVHEWGHLRWGLYDEYGLQSKFYQHAGTWEPVRCTEKVKGLIGVGERCDGWSSKQLCDIHNTRQNMNEDCRFCPSTSQSANTSIMSYQFVPSLTLFCDKDDPATPEWKRHNRLAPNMQNEMCGGKSAWEVMREHEDFANGSSPVLHVNTNTTPEFYIIQESGARRVFVLDISGSMSGSRIESLHDTGVYIVQEVLRNGSWLGIVWFNSTAMQANEIVIITDDSVRMELIHNLPSKEGGGTCIGCGINLAIEMLEAKFKSAKGCEIILMSDGEDGYENEFLNASQRARSVGVVIHAVSISQAADPRMISLASDTGGKHFNYLEDQSGISFAAVFSEAVSGGITETGNQAVTILSDSARISSDRLHFAFKIETGLGKRTSVSVLTPLNTTLNMTIIGTDSFYEYSAVGKYLTWTIKHLGRHPILVTSRLSTTKFDFSLESVDLPVLYVDVTKGKAPVVGAIIEARVEESSILCTLSPKNNGQDPDSLEGDGTYSVYLLPKCLTNGRLNIRVTVNGQANDTSVIKSINGASAIDAGEEESEIISDSFQRFSLPEPIYVERFSTNTSDIVAPGRITDVKILGIETLMTLNGESRNFTIAWTATGNDMNIGQASSYEIRYADDIDSIFHNFSSAYFLDIGNVSLTPKQSGMLEAIVISVNAEKTYTDTAYLGIVAVDEAGNQGKVSNIVSVVVAKGFRMSFEGETNNTEFEDEIITSPATTVTTETVTATTVATETVTATTVATDTVTATTVTTDAVAQDVSSEQPYVDDSHTGLIVGVSVGVLAVMVVVVGLILFIVLRKRSKQFTYNASLMGHSTQHERAFVNFVAENT
ncbi:CLCA4-like protein [Mya arenaria]|uniref:CLCA4-like protein n=1 Tax=Mya arenaria TaxID=6604 RepID=A0ABY7G3C7_MYAAR|nr:CLCA4-like protein [Mya arenaria]